MAVSVVAPPRKRAPNPRTIWVIAGSVVAVAVIALVLANMADSGNKKPTAKGKPNAPATTVPKSRRLELAVGKVVIQNTGAPTKVVRATRRTLLSNTQFYVDGAVLAPLQGGHVNRAFAKIFDAGVRTTAARNDAAVLTEAGTGKVSSVTATASPVRIDALGDPTGKVALAATSWTMNIKAPTPKGRLTIRRKTELTFANVFGKWYVTAYKVTVRRSIGAKTASQTITAGGVPNGVSS
jgi:hypothetical protein